MWLYVAKESGNADIANRLIDALTDRFLLLADFPYAGRVRDEDFGKGLRSFSMGSYVIIYAVKGEDTIILRVVHGKRDLGFLFDW